MYKTPTFAEPQQCNRPFSTGLDIGKTYLNRKRAKEFTDYIAKINMNNIKNSHSYLYFYALNFAIFYFY